MTTSAIDPARIIGRWQHRIFWLLWTAYASYYLCRVNFAVAQPEILREFGTWTATQVGWIPSVYAAFYAVGQFINGMVGARVGARRMLTAALLTAAACNIGMSATSSFSAMLALWALNGFAQSAGWSLVVHTMSNWTASGRRGTLMGLLSTCYQFGNVASWLLAGQLCASIGWRAAFWVPALMLLPVAVMVALWLRDSPEQAGLGTMVDEGPSVAWRNQAAGGGRAGPGGALSIAELLAMTLSNRTLWVLGLGYLCMNAVRYAFMNWSVQYMADFHGTSIQGSAFTAVAIPLLGALGAMGAGWASDQWFGRRRAPVCALMLCGLGAVCAGFVYVPQGWWLLATGALGLAGFLVFGPDMLMSGAASVDASHPRAAAASTGLIMSMGAIGSIFSGTGVGWLRDRTQGSWSLVFWVLAGLSLVSAALMASIWNARPRSG